MKYFAYMLKFGKKWLKSSMPPILLICMLCSSFFLCIFIRTANLPHLDETYLLGTDSFLGIVIPDNWTQSLQAYYDLLQQEKHFKVFWDVANSPMQLYGEIRVLTTAETIPITIPVYGLICAPKAKSKTTSPTKK